MGWTGKRAGQRDRASSWPGCQRRLTRKTLPPVSSISCCSTCNSPILRAEPALPRLQSQVREIAELLEEKESIPLVGAQMPLIQELQTDEFWTDVTLAQLETVRKRLRDLVKFIEKNKRKVVYTDFEDEIGAGTEVTLSELASSIDVAQYRKKVMAFLTAQREHPAVLKLRLNEPLTPADVQHLESLLYDLGGEGSRAQFERTYGKPEAWARSSANLSDWTGKRPRSAFGKYLADTQYNATQIRFINQIIDYLTQNGVMDAGLLYEQPFTNYSSLGLDGLFPEKDAADIVQILAMINRNAGLPRHGISNLTIIRDDLGQTYHSCPEW